jgi:hypothetical protein
MEPIQSKRAFGDTGEQCLLCVSPTELFAAERKRLNDPVVGFKSHSQAQNNKCNGTD